MIKRRRRRNRFRFRRNRRNRRFRWRDEKFEAGEEKDIKEIANKRPTLVNQILAQLDEDELSDKVHDNENKLDKKDVDKNAGKIEDGKNADNYDEFWKDDKDDKDDENEDIGDKENARSVDKSDQEEATELLKEILSNLKNN